MTGSLREKPRAVLDRPAFRIGGGVDKPSNTGQADGARAHGTRLKRHIERCPDKPLIAETACAFPDSEHLRMGRRIARFDDPIAGPREQFAVRGNEHSANRHFAAFPCSFGFGQGKAQILQVLLFHGPLGYPKAMTKTDEPTESERGERIAKVIARAGVCSRRDAEKMIAEGRVALNGERIVSPALNVPADALITVDGKPIPTAAPAKLWRYHKPAGLVTSHRDPQGRPTVFEKLPRSMPRAISVGRLDINSEGLLLLTNDGALARQLELPSQGWVRRYRVRLFGKVTQADLDKLAKGVTIEGVRYEPVTAELERSKTSNAWATVSLKEGKNREVKRLMEFLGFKVSRLIRVSFGPFHLGHLPEGAVDEIAGKVWREQLGLNRKSKSEREEERSSGSRSHAPRRPLTPSS
jgi:23S rRNA pseudouridine2605 synthase